MPQKSTRRTAANHHDKRHETGLAAPGKRIPKQRSSQALNGQTNGKAISSTPPLPASDVDQYTPLPATPNGSAHATDTDIVGKMPAKPCADGRERSPSDASLDYHDNYNFELANGSMDPTSSTSRRTDANGSLTTPGYTGNVFSLAATILSSCPLQDVIAILIILLHLGPTTLTIIQFLFTALTFVPPPSTTTAPTIPSITDMFHGSGGTPSFGLMIFIDVVIWGLWVVLWVPLQNFLLDFAQAVIAISLGGAAAGKEGMTYSIAFSFTIITASNLNKCGYLRDHLMHAASIVLAKGGYSLVPAPNSPTPVRSATCSISHGWLRNALGIHIMAQGFLRMIRRWLSRKDQQATSAAGQKASDADALLSASVRKNSAAADTNPDAQASASTDGRPPGPSPAKQDAKEKAIQNKRKRRQAAHVRSQQPFWAAIASTKVTVVKEMEQKNANGGLEEGVAKDASHIGNAQFEDRQDKAWVTKLGSKKATFEVNLFEPANAAYHEEDESRLKGTNAANPFHIRVNDTVWRYVSISKLTSTQHGDDGRSTVWKAEISGLTGFSNYNVDIVRTMDDAVICTTSITTAQDPHAEQAPTASPAAPKLRPSSPATTLRNSIEASEQTLAELRNRSKRNKRDHTSQLRSLKAEVEKLNNRLAGAGGNDDRQTSKLLQLKRDIEQNDEASALLDAELAAHGDIPEEEFDEYAAKKKAWKAEKDREATMIAEVNKSKAEADREVAEVEADIAQALQKKERLVARQTKVNDQEKRLRAAALEEEKRREQRKQMMTKRATEEQGYLQCIGQMEHGAAQLRSTISDLEAQVQHLDSLLPIHQQQNGPSDLHDAHMNGANMAHSGAQYGNVTAPSDLPESHMNGANMAHTGAQYGTVGAYSTLNPSATFWPPTFGAPNNSHYYPGQRRTRASSMFSDASGFTEDLIDEDFEDANNHNFSENTVKVPQHQFPGAYSWGGAAINGEDSGTGSGSSGSTGSGSQRDPLSPAPQSAISFGFPASSMSPVGSNR